MGPGPRHRGRSRAWGIALALLFLAVLASVVALTPRVLTSLVVPERAPVRDLLENAVPTDLDFMFPATHYLKQSDTISPLAEVLLGKDARLLRIGAGSELVPGYEYQFDYGYKGETVRVFGDGRAQIRLSKSEILHKHEGVLGLLWGKFGDQEPGDYIYYETDADSELRGLAEAAYKAALAPAVRP